MAKNETLTEGEKIFTINIRNAYKKSERKRAPYAMRAVKIFLKKHTKADNIKLGTKLNEAVWARGMKKPAASVRVKAVRDGDTIKAELVGFEYADFRAKPREERKGAKEKLLERLGPKAAQNEQEEKKIEGKEDKDEAKKSDSEGKK